MKTLCAVVVLSWAMLGAHPVRAETTLCTEITSVPTTISVQGVYCLKQNLTTSVGVGSIITIAASNVTIDMNGYKLGGLNAGATSQAVGVAATDRRNITVRNGTIQGFRRGIVIDGSTSSSGHLLEDLRVDRSLQEGIEIGGSEIVVRNNLVLNTGMSATGSSVLGIMTKNAGDAIIEGNLVDGVSGTNFAYGIVVNVSASVVVSGNTIFGVDTAVNRYGIEILSSTNVAIAGNRILNSTPGSTGVDNRLSQSQGVDCIDNIVRGYTTSQHSCAFLLNNNFN